MKLVISILLCLTVLVQADKKNVSVHEKFLKFSQKYCVSCHGNNKKKGGLNLEPLEREFKNASIAQDWQDVLDVLNIGDMPPEEAKEIPSKEEMSDAIDALTLSIREARHSFADSGGRPIIRRLNRREIKNMIEELLGVHVNEESLPDDDKVNSFDTVGDSLTMSSVHIEKISNLARVSLNKLKPVAKQSSKVTRKDYKNNVEKNEEAYQKYKALIAAGKFRNSEVTEDDYKQMTPTQKGSYESHLYKYWKNRKFEGYGTGSFLFKHTKHNKVSVQFKGLPYGLYKVRLKVGISGEKSPYGESLHIKRDSSNRSHPMYQETYDYFHVKGTFQEPQIIEFTYDHRPDLPESLNFALRSDHKVELQTYQKMIGFEDKTPKHLRDHFVRKHQTDRLMKAYNPKTVVWVDWTEIEGPFYDGRVDKFQEIFFKGLTDQSDSYAKEIVERFAVKAFRGHGVQPEEIKSFMYIYDLAKNNGRDFEASVKAALSAVLTSPNFLYIQEKGTDKKSVISNLELANRLSLFLWSTMPDEQLMKLAKDGSLKDSKVLESQIRRMLLSAKSEAFFQNFVNQWLEVPRILDHKFLYAEFDKVAVEAARQEPIEFFKEIIRSNLSLDNLLDSDFLVINQPLSKLYGLKGVEGDEFRKVSLEKDSVRGGLLAMSGVLAKLSDGYQNRTIDRGAYVLRKLLDNPPADPPPNVELPKLSGKNKSSKRQILEVHKENPACASCHRKIDPIGFGMENFNAIGLWRTKEIPYNGRPPRFPVGANEIPKSSQPAVEVDSSGSLNGKAFASFLELRQLIHQNYKDQLVSSISKALINYGACRTVSFTDRPVINELIMKTKKNGYKGMDFMIDFIKSEIIMKK